MIFKVWIMVVFRVRISDGRLSEIGESNGTCDQRKEVQKGLKIN